MPQTRVAMGKRSLARIQRLCCLGVGGEMLMPDLITEISRLLPSLYASFWWLGPNFRVSNGYGTIPKSTQELWAKEFYDTHLENEVFLLPREWATSARPGNILRFEDLLHADSSTFQKSDYYNLLMKPANMGGVVGLRVREGGRFHGMLFAHQAVGAAPFEAADLKMLEAIAGFVAHGMTRPTLLEDALADSDDRAVIVAAPDGRVRHAGAEAQRLLRMALNPRMLPAARWPDAYQPVLEIASLCRSLTATAEGHLGHAAPVLRLQNPWGAFILRAYWLGPTDGVEKTRDIAVTIQRRVPRPLAVRRRVEDLPLSGREKQLCFLLTRDPSLQELSAIMGVAPSTVITHQRNIYVKLGVHSRVGLREALELT